jgi:hypothetical protein
MAGGNTTLYVWQTASQYQSQPGMSGTVPGLTFGTLIRKGAGRGSEGNSVMGTVLSFSEVRPDVFIESSTSGCAVKYRKGANSIISARTVSASIPITCAQLLRARTPFVAKLRQLRSTPVRPSRIAATQRSSPTPTPAAGVVARSAVTKLCAATERRGESGHRGAG